MTVAPEKLFEKFDATVVEKLSIGARPARFLPTPKPYSEGATGAWLRATVGGDGKLFRHQALALARIAAGENLVVATGTASGKSMIFLTPIVHELLVGGGKALILYPLKALAGDQLGVIERALAQAGLDRSLVGEINGDVAPQDRDQVLARCRVVLATPDVIHSWMMRQVNSPVVQQFLRDLGFLVLDEAHALEDILGSNCAFLIRRQRSAHGRVQYAREDGGRPLQVIAATATISEPVAHLERLTGCAFSTITEEDNGAPFHGLTLLHIDGPARGATAEKMLANLCRCVAEEIGEQALIAFADSRQGVEHVTCYIDREDILPYRGGYDGRDRRKIEASLRAKELRGVVSTSALELGIDIPQFVVGLNLGLPQTRKALRQRIGRIGRTMPGVFAVITPASTFTQLGGSFREFLEAEVEPSRLYLDNRFIQFQAARCLHEECGGEGDVSLPDNVDWPPGFAEMFAAAQPGAMRPRDLDQIACMGGNSPHIAYPLRAICEGSFALRDIRNPQEIIGTIELEKALREAPPGATYHHLRRAYRVVEWRTNSYERSILLQHVKHAEVTQALLSTQVSVSTDPGELIDKRMLQGEEGVLAEILLRVSDSVQGYRIGSTALLYRDLSKTNRRMSWKHREFSTTGVLIRIPAGWFSGDGDPSLKQREAVAKALAAILAREHNIAPSDIRTAHARIAICGGGGARRIEDAIVIFDNVVGGLRLTSPLFSGFTELLDRLDRAAAVAGEEALLGSATVERLRSWYGSLSPSGGSVEPLPSCESGEVVVFAPLSQVCVRVRGALVERTILEPQYVTIGDTKVLMYRYDAGSGASGWVAHDQVDPIGHDWQRAIWNPVSNEIRDVAA